MINPIELPETSTIFGDLFPTHNEEAYAREAAAQRDTSAHATDSAAAARAAATYTQPNFRGLSGAKLAERMTDHHATLSDDAARHANVADLLDTAADNITTTKQQMNAVSVHYHTSYDEAKQTAVDETWTQSQLQAEKTRLMSDAQSSVTTLRSRFDSTHDAVRSEVRGGVTPVGNVRSDDFDYGSTFWDPEKKHRDGLWGEPGLPGQGPAEGWQDVPQSGWPSQDPTVIQQLDPDPTHQLIPQWWHSHQLPNRGDGR